MKKINYLNMFALTATAAMLLPSCSNDDIDIQTGDATVTLSATLPESLQTRSFGDGLKAKNLQMVVLEAGDKGITGGNLGVFDGGATVYKTTFANGSLTTNVPVKLVTGKKYAVICWSDAGSASPYEYDAVNHKVKADYTGFTTSDDNLDAFYAYQTFTVEGDGTQTIQLRRPFAQLNIGTDDLAAAKAAGFTVETVKVKVPVYRSMDLRTGDVIGEPLLKTFYEAPIPADTEEFPSSAGGDYKYLAMNYLLTSADKSLVDVELRIDGNNRQKQVHTFNTVPIQRNYRTNIYGSILTDDVNVTVEIIPDFDGSFPSYSFADNATDVANQLSSGLNVLLNKDIAPAEMMRITGGHDVNLNLGGKTIANTVDIWGDTANAMLSLRGGTTLTIDGNGTMKAKKDDCYVFDVKDNSHLIIEDGYFNGNVSVVQVEEGTAEIKGGTFELQQLWNGKATYMLNCIDANYQDGTAKIIVTGGTFIGFNPADCAAEVAHTNFVADGYESILVDAATKTYQVVKIDQVVTSFTDIANALNTNNSNILIGSSFTADKSIDVKNTASISLNDGTVVTASNSQNGAVEVIGGNKGRGYDGQLTLNGSGKFVGPSNKTSGWMDTYAIKNSKGVLNIYGNITFDGGSGNTTNNALYMMGGTTNIYGGYFYTGVDKEGKANACILLDADNSCNAVCNIYGGVFDAAKPQPYLLNIQDDVRSKCKFNVMGGTFVGFNPADNSADGEHTNYVAPGYKSVKTTYNGKDAWKVVKQ